MATRKPLVIGTDGFPEEMPITDDIQVGGLASTGNITLSGGAEVTGLPASPSGATSAASKAYVDSAIAGFNNLKASARVATTTTLTGWVAAGSGVGKTLTSPTTATSNNDFDGVTLSVNDRILVKDGPSAVDNGIYVMTTLADGASQAAVLTRATDADQDAEVTAGMFLFVTEGTVYGDTGWVMATDDPITVDTTVQNFSQFSGPGAFVGGNGIDITGNTVSVDLTTDAGLEFNAGQLRVKLDGSTLNRATAGLSVLGLPSLFTINGVAVGASVTAANLDTLTDGSSADALHTHTGIDLAKRLQEDLNVDVAIAVGDPVDWSSTTADRIRKADASVGSAIDVFGVATTAQTTIGSPATVVRRGIAAGVLTGASPGTRYFLASGGGLTSNLASLGSGDRIVFIGTAVNATDLEVNPQYLGRKN